MRRAPKNPVIGHMAFLTAGHVVLGLGAVRPVNLRPVACLLSAAIATRKPGRLTPHPEDAGVPGPVDGIDSCASRWTRTLVSSTALSDDC